MMLSGTVASSDLVSPEGEAPGAHRLDSALSRIADAAGRQAARIRELELTARAAQHDAEIARAAESEMRQILRAYEASDDPDARRQALEEAHAEGRREGESAAEERLRGLAAELDVMIERVRAALGQDEANRLGLESAGSLRGVDDETTAGSDAAGFDAEPSAAEARR
ncbi:hypothetical protein [Rhizosaccharibacter radicis]|uniref:Uncharacterized protein n=1 Tax=Rhizosaccharibacter radicis TaxID=2782605 RepID=A0ABT1VWZ6_9PROT|nr:hypothetical protein [Acetobacteraceae bacterium KSS12]